MSLGVGGENAVRKLNKSLQAKQSFMKNFAGSIYHMLLPVIAVINANKKFDIGKYPTIEYSKKSLWSALRQANKGLGKYGGQASREDWRL